MPQYANNPILPGFNPDPSICRVGDDYYIATSTFEWYPGVQVFHSTDLVNWTLVARPLNRQALLDMRGVPDSCGVWAPCLSYEDGRFWLLYTVTRRFDGNFKDTPNYLTTCERIDGDWSDPVYLNSSGFDPSLFHDSDGRKYYLNMVWDHRPNDTYFRGIVMQEYEPDNQRLLGDRQLIFEGSSLDYTEGPHLYRFGDFYYLITAEGGTGYGHAVTIARSETIDGPYIVDPEGAVVTASHDSSWPLQRAGHGDIVVTQNGELYLVHLCSRPLEGERFSPLGRETAIQKLRMTDDGWLRMDSGDKRPQLQTPVPPLAESPVASAPDRDNFDSGQLSAAFQWLRTPQNDAWMSLKDRPGHLRLYGQESTGSLFEQALVARRQQHHRFEAETEVSFEPQHFQQMAGLICYYNSSKFHYLYLSTDGERGKHLNIMSCKGKTTLELDFPIDSETVPMVNGKPVRLRAQVRGASLQFAWCYPGESWQDIGPELDARILSDEAGKGEGAQFTGNFVGITCNDVAGTRHHADFDYFRYVELCAD